MNVDFNIFKPYLLSFSKDERITVWHIAVIFGVIQLATNGSTRSPIYISRKKVMQLSHINSIVTYHKCIKDLQQYGYIEYIPSYHPAFGSKVYLL